MGTDMEKSLSYKSQFPISSLFAYNWWVFALRGTLSIILGCIALFIPYLTILTITLILGAYTIADGVFYIIAGINRIHVGRYWGGLIISGIASIIIGLILLVFPQLSSIGLSTFLWLMISCWVLVTGIFEIIAAFKLRQEDNNVWILVLRGVLSVILGVVTLVLLWANPIISMVALSWVIGLNSLTSGIMLIMFALRLYKIKNTILI